MWDRPLNHNRNNLTGHHLLNLLYSKSGVCWLDLCEEYGSYTTNFMELLWCLEALAEAEFVTVDGIGNDSVRDFLHECLYENPDNAATKKLIRVSSKWRHVQQALTTHYADSFRYYRKNGEKVEYSMTVKPAFGCPVELQKQMDVFVAMPFAEEMKPIYTNHIYKSVTSGGFSCGRTDDIFSTNAIVQDLWSAIVGSAIVIGDCTGRNPNVFYELGIAHTLGKPVILITQDKDDVPFDIQHFRYIKYQYTAEGMILLERSLCETLAMIRKQMRFSRFYD